MSIDSQECSIIYRVDFECQGLTVSLSRWVGVMIKRELLGFTSVGALGFLIDFGLFNLLLALGSIALLSNFASVTLAAFVVYVGNLRLSFRHVKIGSRSKSIWRFLLLTIVTVAVNNALVWAAFHALGTPSALEANAVKAFVVALLFGVRFLVMKFYIYLR